MKRQVRLGEDVQKAVLSDKICVQGLPWQLSGKEPTYQRRGLGTWVQPLVWDPTCLGAAKPVPSATEPGLQSRGRQLLSPVPWSPGFTREQPRTARGK